jgi:hypothetical protein
MSSWVLSAREGIECAWNAMDASDNILLHVNPRPRADKLILCTRRDGKWDWESGKGVEVRVPLPPGKLRLSLTVDATGWTLRNLNKSNEVLCNYPHRLPLDSFVALYDGDHNPMEESVGEVQVSPTSLSSRTRSATRPQSSSRASCTRSCRQRARRAGWTSRCRDATRVR